MLSFGDFKNNVQKLKKYMTKMNVFEELALSKNCLEQKQLRTKPTQFYLQIIHYAITSFNDQLYTRILDIVPNIKTLSDQKFAESVLNISRKLMDMDPAITADQLLSNKYAEKKVQFVADLCMNVYEWSLANKKQGSKEGKNTEAKSYMYEPPQIKDTSSDQNLLNLGDQEEDELEQRQITVEPTRYDVHAINNSFGPINPFAKSNNLNDQSDDLRKILKQTVTRSKPNVFPKNINRQYLEDLTSEQNEFITTQKMGKAEVPAKASIAYQSISQKDESVEYVSKQQFNEVLEMMAKMNNTLNDLAAKFTNFQSTVTYWVNNTNAKISILEQNVKTIKANL